MGICRVYADLTSTPMLIKSNNGWDDFRKSNASWIEELIGD